MAVRQSEQSEAPRPRAGRGGGERPPVLAFVLALGAALAAAAAARLVGGTLGWVVAGAVALAGAGAVIAFAHGDRGDSRARRLLATLYEEEGADERAVWEETPGAWGDLYQRMNDLLQEKMTSSTAFVDLERMKRHAELATTQLREGKDPMTEVAELRVGPLHDLLDAARDSAGRGPIVSRLPMGEDELIGADGDPLPGSWPAAESRSAAVDPRARAEATRGLDELIRGLEILMEAMSAPASAGAPNGPGAGATRTPAQLVDAVVHTAADGIEDLAAGLMRASELASVAERVTNRATLLALNAAIEATRSGSEAFASIAEETRRLAEFAREATDTISRLSTEIEYKVGETITAIHETSEDAKSAVSALSGGEPAPVAPSAHRGAVKTLLSRARAIREEWEAAANAAALANEAPPPNDRSPGFAARSEPGAPYAMREAPGPDEATDPDEPPPLELSPRFEEPSSAEPPHDLSPDAPPAGEDPNPDYLRLLDRLTPGSDSTS